MFFIGKFGKDANNVDVLEVSLEELRTTDLLKYVPLTIKGEQNLNAPDREGKSIMEWITETMLVSENSEKYRAYFGLLMDLKEDPTILPETWRKVGEIILASNDKKRREEALNIVLDKISLPHINMSSFSDSESSSSGESFVGYGNKSPNFTPEGSRSRFKGDHSFGNFFPNLFKSHKEGPNGELMLPEKTESGDIILVPYSPISGKPMQ